MHVARVRISTGVDRKTHTATHRTSPPIDHPRPQMDTYQHRIHSSAQHPENDRYANGEVGQRDPQTTGGRFASVSTRAELDEGGRDPDAHRTQQEAGRAVSSVAGHGSSNY